MNNHIGLKGIFNLKFTNVKTGQIRELEFTNLILNSGLDRIAIGGFIAGCVLGSASSTPVVTDTSITSILGSSTTLQAYGVGTANTSTPPYWCSYYWTYRFIEGVATGNISQVAMAFGTVSAGTTLFSLALVKDSGGTPITITKLADEVLDVTYTLQLFCPSADVTGTISISGVNYDYTARPAQAAYWTANNPISTSVVVLAYPASSTLGTQLTAPSGSYADNAAETYSAYTAGTFYKDLAIYWDLNNGNVSGGIRCIYISAGSVWQIRYSKTSDSSAIPKDATKRLTLNIRLSWGRV
jgi:hypothetical protein